MGFFIFKLYNDTLVSNNLIADLNNKMNNLENIVAQTNSSSNIQSQSQNQSQIEKLEITDALVKKLHGYILKSDDFDSSFAWSNSLEPASFYKNTKTTYSSLSNMEKMLIILKNYDASEIKKVNKSQLKNIINTAGIHDTVNVYENINKKTLEIFNQTNSNWENYTGCSAYLNYNNDCYYLSVFEGGGKGTSEYGYAEIQKAEKGQEYLCIYDKYIYVDFINVDLNEGDSKIHIYTSANKTNDIGTETEIGNYGERTITVSNLYKKYENQLKTYKHTFKKADSGSYYWLSSEIYE